MVVQNAKSYYAQGGRVPLEPAKYVAFLTELAAASRVSKNLINEVKAEGRELTRNVYLVAISKVKDQLDELDEKGVTQPVFRDPSGALVVLLPELRVETTTKPGLARVRKAVHKLDHLEVLRDDGEQLLLRPTSGRGLDALDLANDLYEGARPAMSQPRFLRVVDSPRPSPHRPA
jgi:hypothetical protein